MLVEKESVVSNVIYRKIDSGENMTVIDVSLGVYIALAINGIFTGLGSALGSYFATKHLIEGSKKLFNRVRGENGIQP